ncbi:STAS domain-containing protein [Lysobacter olei]
MTALTLPADLGIEHVSGLQQLLSAHVEDAQALELVASDVRRVHAAGVQLLHAFACERARNHYTTLVTQASPALVDALRLLGLAVSLGVDAPSDSTGDSV